MSIAEIFIEKIQGDLFLEDSIYRISILADFPQVSGLGVPTLGVRDLRGGRLWCLLDCLPSSSIVKSSLI